MKGFFKYVFASMFGSILLFLLIFLVFVVVGLSKKMSSKPSIQEHCILKLNFNYPIEDRIQENPFSNFAPASDIGQPLGLNNIIYSIKKASSNNKIEGILLDLTFVGAGMASTQEIRDALIEFKKSGKFVYAYSDIYMNNNYYLASLADSVFINPQGEFLYNGMSASVTFIKGMLDKLGIKMQVFKKGKFKGAVEPLIGEKLSEANRQQITSYLMSNYNHFTNQISESREVINDSLKVFADEFRIESPLKALEYGLVDALMYRDELENFLKGKTGVENDEKLNLVELSKYYSTISDTKKGNSSKDEIAVVYCSGSIEQGEGNDNSVGSIKYAKILRKIKENDNIKAVVLRINSPGGSALASDIIWRELTELKKKKPIIVSMGDVAASGGYYIACMADTIVALPSTITGSIGVFGVFPNMQELLNDKMGLQTEYVNTGKYSEFGRIDRPLKDYEREIIQRNVEEIYNDFIKKVALGRNTTKDKIDSIAQGRVWTGAQAKEIGLVDVLGDFNDALAIASSRAGLEEYKIGEYPKMKSFFEQLFNQEMSVKNKIKEEMKAELGEFYSFYQTIQSAKTKTGVQAMMPYIIELK